MKFLVHGRQNFYQNGHECHVRKVYIDKCSAHLQSMITLTAIYIVVSVLKMGFRDRSIKKNKEQKTPH